MDESRVAETQLHIENLLFRDLFDFVCSLHKPEPAEGFDLGDKSEAAAAAAAAAAATAAAATAAAATATAPTMVISPFLLKPKLPQTVKFACLRSFLSLAHLGLFGPSGNGTIDRLLDYQLDISFDWHLCIREMNKAFSYKSPR